MWHEHASSAAGHHLLQSLAAASDATDAAAGGAAAAGAVPLLQTAPLMLLQAVPLMLLQCGREGLGRAKSLRRVIFFLRGVYARDRAGQAAILGRGPVSHTLACFVSSATVCKHCSVFTHLPKL